mgnify:CR=1 FL=1
MKATDFNVYNIKNKYDFKDSSDFIKFLEITLKDKIKQRDEAKKSLENMDYINSGASELIKDKEFLDFIKRAREQVQKRLNKLEADIKVIKNDLDIVRRNCSN